MLIRIKKKHFVLIIIIIIVLIYCQKSTFVTNSPKYDYSLFLKEGNYTADYWPTDGWRACRPEEVGMDSIGLMAVYGYAANPNLNTEGLIIIKKGYIVGEAYFQGFSPSTRHDSYSVAKSFSSALIGIAVDRGLISTVDEKIYCFFSQWQTPNTDTLKQSISIEHVLQMGTGLEWKEDNYYEGFEATDVYAMIQSNDHLEFVLNKPINDPPGTIWRYSTGNSALLSGVIEYTSGATAYNFARENLFNKIGTMGIIWDHDRAGHTITGFGIHATVREFAKFGYLYQNYGEWDGEQVVSRAWIEKSMQPVTERVHYYGYHWWRKSVFQGHDESNVPENTMIAWGIYTQQIFIMPDEEIVIVRVGNDPNPSEDDWKEIEFLTLVLQAQKK